LNQVVFQDETNYRFCAVHQPLVLRLRNTRRTAYTAAWVGVVKLPYNSCNSLSNIVRSEWADYFHLDTLEQFGDRQRKATS
jgi:hypothetical protein